MTKKHFSFWLCMPCRYKDIHIVLHRNIIKVIVVRTLCILVHRPTLSAEYLHTCTLAMPTYTIAPPPPPPLEYKHTYPSHLPSSIITTLIVFTPPKYPPISHQSPPVHLNNGTHSPSRNHLKNHRVCKYKSDLIHFRRWNLSLTDNIRR